MTHRSCIFGSPARAGFTLVDLLVLIALIGVLLGLVLPAAGLVGASAAQAKCAANLRNWSVALQTYALQNDGVIPRRGQGWQEVTQINRSDDWFNALPPMLGVGRYQDLVTAGRMPERSDGSVWVCPSSGEKTGTYYFSYGMNMWLSNWHDALPHRIGHVGPGETMVSMADAPVSHSATLPGNPYYAPAPRHRRGANLVFLDGHVIWTRDLRLEPEVHLSASVRWRVPGSQWSGPPASIQP